MGTSREAKRAQLARARVHVAGPLEPRRVPLIDPSKYVSYKQRDLDLDDRDVTHEIRCLRCDAELPGSVWKVGERVTETLDDTDEPTRVFQPAAGSELRAGETDCHAA